MDSKVLFSAKGINGTLDLLEDRVRIRREGLMANLYGDHTTSEMMLAQIKSLEMKSKAHGLAWYLAFHDGTEREITDDFCISFLKAQLPAFETAKRKIEERRAQILALSPDANMEIFQYEGVGTTQGGSQNYVEYRR